MNTNQTNYPPIHPKKASKKQDEKWDEALALFRTGNFDQVLPTLLDYIDRDLHSKKNGNRYEIPHGSVVLSITQTADEILVNCPFLDITNAKKVPLMRRLAELRMYPLNLATILIKDNLVFFTFSCPIQLCEPYKIYAVLREICLYADSFDDELIEKFGATHLQEPLIHTYLDDQKEEAFSTIQKIVNEGLNRYDYYLEKRQSSNAWYSLNCTLKKIEFYAEPQGYLRSQLEKAVNGIQDNSEPFQTRLLQGRTSLEKLGNYPKEKFLECLYQIETFIPYKFSGKKENIRENWEDSYNQAQEMISNYLFEDACNLMQSCIYGLFYYNLVDEPISKPLTDALSRSSGLEWSLAAPILMEGMESIMEDSIFGDQFGMDLSKIMGSQMKQSMAAIQQMMANFKTT